MAPGPAIPSTARPPRPSACRRGPWPASRSCSPAALLYSGFDAITKWLVADFSPFQILFFRALFAYPAWALWVAREAQPARILVTPQPGMQVLRGVIAFAALSCFALAFRYLPLALAVAIAYSAPLFTTLLARPVLGERVGRARWALVAVGFAGVLLITRPGDGALEAGVAWAVAGAFLYALTALATRRLGDTDRPPTSMFYTMTVYVVLGANILPFVWRTPETWQWGGFVAIGLVGGLAQFLMLQAYRLAPASTVAPFEYTILAWSVIWGFVVWQELPDTVAVSGMLVIAAAGLALARHEHRSHRRAARGDA
ncbi:MAG: DMT family transporter [Halofilum sp. (in: g-proteobacteria)]|nr:DMT family transporter [Halofilum sp. (in: g-proteobacteria)]